MSKCPFSENEKLTSFLELQRHVLEYENLGKKYFIGRLSGNETSLVGKALCGKVIPQYLINDMLHGAGIKFNTTDDIKKYVIEYNNAISKSTLLCVWDSQMYIQAEDYYIFIDKIYPNIKKICAHSLEPYYFMCDPEYKFNELLNGKKILIISSHIKTIENQLINIDKLFPKKIFGNNVQFNVYKPPQQNAGNDDSNSWGFHLDKMKENLENIKLNEFNFDLALVSAGGFGMLISNYIFDKLDSSVIYVGGPLQLFFGINGSRWENNKIINDSKNKYWTNVLNEDMPKNPSLCENSCYW
jgi:hypothetical protein